MSMATRAHRYDSPSDSMRRLKITARYCMPSDVTASSPGWVDQQATLLHECAVFHSSNRAFGVASVAVCELSGPYMLKSSAAELRALGGGRAFFHKFREEAQAATPLGLAWRCGAEDTNGDE